jgi:hypothetical protein
MRTEVSADGQQQLVLLTGQAGRPRLLVAPVQEATERGAEVQQLGVLLVAEPILVRHLVTSSPRHLVTSSSRHLVADPTMA